jgi:hypothetical protein
MDLPFPYHDTTLGPYLVFRQKHKNLSRTRKAQMILEFLWDETEKERRIEGLLQELEDLGYPDDKYGQIGRLKPIIPWMRVNTQRIFNEIPWIITLKLVKNGMAPAPDMSQPPPPKDAEKMLVKYEEEVFRMLAHSNWEMQWAEKLIRSIRRNLSDDLEEPDI